MPRERAGDMAGRLCVVIFWNIKVLHRNRRFHPLYVRILRWCFPLTDVLSVCTDVEFDVCGICVPLSTFSESLLGQNKQTSYCLNTCDTYFLVPRWRRMPYGHDCSLWTTMSSLFLMYSSKRKKTELNKSEGLFPFSLERWSHIRLMNMLQPSNCIPIF